MDKIAFFDSAQRESEYITVNGFEMTIRSLSLRQREELPNRISQDSASGVAWIVVSGVDDFDESDLDDVLNMDHVVLEEIANHVLRISGLATDSESEAKND